jgi:hypothetical protein
VYAQILPVHDRREGQRTERLEAGLVYALRIFVLALGLECEFIGQVPALVVATEEEKGFWIPNLEGPKVQQTLEGPILRYE